MIEFDDFQKIDIRVGKIERAEAFSQARNPAYKIWINFGDDIGIKKTSAQNQTKTCRLVGGYIKISDG